jgi:hypothetical protein
MILGLSYSIYKLFVEQRGVGTYLSQGETPALHSSCKWIATKTYARSSTQISDE